MPLEKGEYEVICLDSHGYEICAKTYCENLYKAKQFAVKKSFDLELVDAGLHRVQIVDFQGKIVIDELA
jgi:hypothetical protein